MVCEPILKEKSLDRRRKVRRRAGRRVRRARVIIDCDSCPHLKACLIPPGLCEHLQRQHGYSVDDIVKGF
jgi:hypothetical protein